LVTFARSLGPLWVVTLAASFSSACSSANSGDSEAYVGSWVYTYGFATALCSGVKVSHELHELEPIEVGIEQAGDEHVVFDAGPDCTFRLSVNERSARSESAVTCRFTLAKTTLIGTFEGFDIALDGDTLIQSSSGGSAEIQAETKNLPCQTFEVSGKLERKDDGRVPKRTGPVP
jgi:hypothetical protein